MTNVARKAWLVAVVTGIFGLMLAVAPLAFAQEAENNSLTCDPANPEAGTETECTVEGLQPSSDFQYTAEFAGGTENSGDGTADGAGSATFTVDVPDEEGDYTVTVTGNEEDGSNFEESFTGTVGGDQQQDGTTETETETETVQATETVTETTTVRAQVTATPEGGVQTGAGGTANSGNLIALAIAVGYVGVAGIGAVVTRETS